MKTILYLLIAIFIFGIIAMGFTNKANTTNNILIQSTDTIISTVLLNKSAEIISNRIKDYSSKKFDVNTIPEKNQIQVILTGNWDPIIVEKLITQKGSFAFYETYNRKTLAELLNGDDHLYSLISNCDTIGHIGCTTPSEVEKTNDYLNTLGLEKECKFVWGEYSEKIGMCLYALKVNCEKGALITGSDIESVKFKSSKYNEIEIKFKKSAIQLWADATKNNLNKTIAIVLDNIVLSSPTVRQEITGGNCSITGNFNQSEGKYFAAIGNNGVLPINFIVLK